MSKNATTALLTVSGHDRPGITSELTRILAQKDISILDISQALVHDLLSLKILYVLPTSPEALLKELQAAAKELDLALDYRELGSSAAAPTAPQHYALTLIADPITASALHEVARVLATHKTNIESIKRLSEGKFGCVEILVSSKTELDPALLKKSLLEIAKRQEVDIALQTEGLYRRAKRLIVMDMDSTLIHGEVIDELARKKGVYEKVSKITARAMAGEISYDESLSRRCEMLRGLTRAQLQEVFDAIQLTPGADDLIRILKKLGYRVALLSGGFTFVADRLKERLGIDFAYANQLEIGADGVLTGRVLPPIINAQRKSDLLDVIAQQEKISLDQVIAIGDGANDIPMLEKAGLGIAFNAKPVVREKADLALSQRNMRSILYLLGLSERDFSEIS